MAVFIFLSGTVGGDGVGEFMGHWGLLNFFFLSFFLLLSSFSFVSNWMDGMALGIG